MPVLLSRPPSGLGQEEAQVASRAQAPACGQDTRENPKFAPNNKNPSDGAGAVPSFPSYVGAGNGSEVRLNRSLDHFPRRALDTGASKPSSESLPLPSAPGTGPGTALTTVHGPPGVHSGLCVKQIQKFSRTLGGIPPNKRVTGRGSPDGKTLVCGARSEHPRNTRAPSRHSP